MIAAGAIISIFSVTLVTMYGQTRILFSIRRSTITVTESRDGMLRRLRKVRPRTRTPSRTRSRGDRLGLLAGLVPLSKLADLTSIGTLAAFTVVSDTLIVLRRTAPDLPRGSRCRCTPFVPIASILFCLFVLAGLPGITFVVFGPWLAAVLPAAA